MQITSIAPAAGRVKTLLNEIEAAEYLDLAPATLATWRCTKRVAGPAYVKMGGAIRYPLAALDKFIAINTVMPGEAA